MSDELIGQLINAGVGVIVALTALAAIWRLPMVLDKLNAILARVFDAADDGAQRLTEANTSLTEAARMMRETTREAIDAKTRIESQFSEAIARLSQVERELKTEREKREALERELASEREARKEDREHSQKQAEFHTSKIRELESALKDKDGQIEILTSERTSLMERVEALELAQRGSKPPESAPDAKAA